MANDWWFRDRRRDGQRVRNTVGVSSHPLYDLPADAIDYSAVLQFVLDAEAANLLTESLTLEIKSRRQGHNVVEAVAALSNTDGGIVLVGVAEDAQGADRLTGVPQAEHDRLSSQLHSLIPTAMPEIVAVRIPDRDHLIVVLRVDADKVLHPVIVAGRVLYRVPGATVPADRQRVIELIDRDRSATPATYAAGHAMTAPSDLPLWGEDEESVATLRVVGGFGYHR